MALPKVVDLNPFLSVGVSGITSLCLNFTMDASVSLIEQRLFHKIDRELYSRIIMDLNLRVTQARQVLVLWLWLEEIGFPNVVAKILEMSDTALRSVVDEAVVCLDSVLLDYDRPLPECDLPMTISVLGKDISLKFFLDHKKSLTEGMIRIMQHIFSTVFEDIEKIASVINAFKATYLGSLNEGTSRDAVVDDRDKQIIQAPGSFPRLQLRPHGEGSSHGMVVDGKEKQVMHAPASFPFPQFMPHGEGSSRGTVVHGGETQKIQAPASFARPQFIPHGEISSHGPVVHGREKQIIQALVSFARPQFIPHGEGNSSGTVVDCRETQMRQTLAPFRHSQMIPMIRPCGEVISRSMMVDGRETLIRQTPAASFPPLHMLPMIRHNVEGSSGMYQMNQGQMYFPQSQLNVNARPWEEYVPECDRTMFITFSRGHPLTEEEIKEFLTGTFGDCIESITMQKVTHPNEDPVYAHVIFKLTRTVSLILDGTRKAKFSFKGKHIWARRWEKRDPYLI